MSKSWAVNHLFVLTGWRGVGKTTLIQTMVAEARRAGWTVGGILSPPRLDGGEKTGIDALDVRTGERRLLASRKAGELEGPVLGPWTFDLQTFAWGDETLRQSLPCDLFVLDEFGPLEFDSRQGWAAAFNVLAQPENYRLAVVVVRPEYLDAFLQRWPRAEKIVLHSTADVDNFAELFTERYWYA